MALLTALRLGTGAALTPFRLLQQFLLKGEELVCVATPSAVDGP